MRSVLVPEVRRRGTARPRSTLRVVLGLAFLVPLVGCGGNAGWRPQSQAPPPMAAERLDAGKQGAGSGTEAYDRIFENRFLSAAENPLATLAVTVDTASYSNVRRFLMQERRLPPRDAVRVAELVNYFSYSYPEPEDGRPVRFTLDMARCPWNSEHQLLRIGMRARSVSPGEMPGRNFVFLLDTSGSMGAENKLPLLKTSLKLLVERMTARDRVAIVVYAGSAGLVLPPTPGSQQAVIAGALDRLAAGGSTNGGQGIELAYRVAQEAFIPGGLNRVILGTDGDFNVGTTSQGDLVRLIEEKRKTGIYLSVLGLGMGNLKDSTMEKLARYGNGHYAYIDSPREAYKLFVEEGGALVTVARDVKLQAEFNPRRVGAYRLIGYENRLLRAEDFNDDTKDVTDVGSGHTVTIFFEIVPAGKPINLPGVDPLRYQKSAAADPGVQNDEWLTVKLRYKDPDRETSELIEAALTQVGITPPEGPTDFRFASAVAEMGLLLYGSEYKGDASYTRVLERARGALGADPHGHRAEFLELVSEAGRLAGQDR